jgi:hypothetical protein
MPVSALGAVTPDVPVDAPPVVATAGATTPAALVEELPGAELLLGVSRVDTSSGRSWALKRGDQK